MSARSTSTLEPACSRSSTRAPISIASATTRAGSSPASIARLTSSAATGSSTTTFSTIRRPTSAWTRVGRSGVAASMSNPGGYAGQRTSKPRRPSGSSALDVERLDLRVARPGAGELHERLDGVRRALEDRLDRAVGAVAHPAGDAAALRLAAGAVAEEDALHAPGGADPAADG